MDENYRAAQNFDRFGRTFDAAGAPFFDAVKPAAFPEHILRYRNQPAAASIGLDGLTDNGWCDHFAGFEPLPQNMTTPLALRYHGHQFQVYNAEIGDGRGFLFAQMRDGQNRLLDLGTKGSGQTPYSRFGDGRLTLKGGVREVLATEMLEALGVYTSKTLSLVETGEALERHDEPSPARSSVLVRLSHSHIRFGMFQRLAFEKDEKAIAALVDYCIEEFYPERASLDGDARVSGFFAGVTARAASMAAQLMAAGFVHGVLNTDNMNITGECFDYGPWRFAPRVDARFTAAYFDEGGLYAYGRQPAAIAWNVARLGDCLAQITNIEALNEVLQSYGPHYEGALCEHVFARLGLARQGGDDGEFVNQWFSWMATSHAPLEQVFFDWFGGHASKMRAKQSPAKEFYARGDFGPLNEKICAMVPADAGRLEHDYFRGDTPCTMLIEEVEAIWDPIARDNDWTAFNAKLDAIAQMRKAYGFNASEYARFGPNAG